MNILNLFWLKIIDIMDGSVFFSSINKFMEFIKKISRDSAIVRFFSIEENKSTVNNNLITKFVDGFLNLFKIIGDKFFINYWNNSFFGSRLNSIHIDDILSNSLFFKAIGYLFELNYKGIGILELSVITVVFFAPFIPTMALAGVVVLITLLFCFKIMVGQVEIIKINLTGIFIILFAIVTLFAGFTSLDKSTSINISILTSVFMLFYILIIMIINTREKFEVMMFSFSLSAFFTGLYGLYQKLSGHVNTTWTDTDTFEGLKLRVYSTFNNPNVYGEYLLLALPISFAMIFYSKKYITKLFYFGVTALLTLNLGLTYSRGCYLALIIAVLVGVLFMEKRLIVFFSAGIFALPFVLPPSIIERIFSITNFTESSTSYRIKIWQATLLALQDFWFYGIGQGGDAFNKVYPLYSFNSVTAPHSHSLFLQIFIETGIVGIIVFVIICCCFFKSLISTLNITNDFKVKMFMVSFICGVVAFLIQGVFDYSFYNYKVYLLFFITLALGNAFVNIIRRENCESN